MNPGILSTLGVFVTAAAAVVLLARWLKIPAIVSYLLAGLACGPVLGAVDPDAVRAGTIGAVGELGIVLLMFLVGAELSFDRLRPVGKVAVAAGLGQVVFTAAGGYVLAWLLGFEPMEALFLAVALTFSSTVVVVKLLDQKGDLHRLYGRIAVGIFLVQDLVVVVILTLLAGLAQAGELTAAAVGGGLLKAGLGMTLLAGVVLAASRWILPRPLASAARRPRLLVIVSLGYCLGVVTLAHSLALSAEIGAFLAGLSLAQQRCAVDLQRRLHPLMTFFVTVFFVSWGRASSSPRPAPCWASPWPSRPSSSSATP